MAMRVVSPIRVTIKAPKKTRVLCMGEGRFPHKSHTQPMSLDSVCKAANTFVLMVETHCSRCTAGQFHHASIGLPPWVFAQLSYRHRPRKFSCMSISRKQRGAHPRKIRAFLGSYQGHGFLLESDPKGHTAVVQRNGPKMTFFSMWQLIRSHTPPSTPSVKWWRLNVIGALRPISDSLQIGLPP